MFLLKQVDPLSSLDPMHAIASRGDLSAGVSASPYGAIDTKISSYNRIVWMFMINNPGVSCILVSQHVSDIFFMSQTKIHMHRVISIHRRKIRSLVYQHGLLAGQPQINSHRLNGYQPSMALGILDRFLLKYN